MNTVSEATPPLKTTQKHKLSRAPDTQEFTRDRVYIIKPPASALW